MGYSCTAAAAKTLNNFNANCLKQTGLSNYWNTKVGDFMYELGAEQNDGSVKATIVRIIDGLGYIVGKFHINPDGKFMKNSGVNYAPSKMFSL